MSKKNIAFIITIIISFIIVIILGNDNFNDINLSFSPIFNRYQSNETGDYLIIQNLYSNRSFSVPRRIKINKSNYKLGDFILLSHLINDQEKELISNANNLLLFDSNNIYAISIVLMDYIKNKNFKELDSFLNSIKITKNNSLFLNLVSLWSKMAQGLEDDAFDILDNIRIDPDFEDLYYIHRGMLCEISGDDDCAVESYNQALNERVSLRTVDLLIKLHIKNNNYSSARNVIYKYLHVRPESDMGQSLKKYIDKIDLKKPVLKRLSYVDGFAGVFFDIGFINQLKNNVNKSILFSKIATLINKNLDFGKLILANVLSSTDKKSIIIDILKTIKKDSYLYEPTQGYIAETLFLMDRHDDSLKIYKSLIKKNTLNLNHYLKVAQIYELKNEYKKALNLYNFIFSKISNKKDKRLWILYFKRGVLYHSMKDLKMAEKDLKMAVKLNPENPVLLNYLGYVLVDNDINVEGSVDMLEKAFIISLNKLPHDPALLKYLSALIVNNDKITKDIITKKLQVGSDSNSNYIDSLGWALYKRKQYNLSVSMLEFGKSIDPTNPFINYHLGEAYFAVGKFYEAVYSWKKSIFYNNFDKKLDNTEEIIKKIKSYEFDFN